MKKEIKKLHPSISVFSFGKTKEKNQMKINKKVLILSLVLLSLIAISVVMVASADETSSSSEPSFFQRWMTSTFSDLDAKLILWLMMFVVLLVLLQSMGLSTGSSLLISLPFSFVLVAYVTPDTIIGNFRTYSTLPLAIST